MQRFKYMKRLMVATLLGVCATAYAVAAPQTAFTSEVLVLNATAVQMRLHAGAKALEIQNLGPNELSCAFSSTITLGKARRVDANGGVWALDSSYAGAQVWCKAKTADQVTGAATIVSEMVP